MKETLEEAAEKYVKSDLKKTPLYWLFYDTFKAGAKWQQEQDNKELAMWKLAVEKQETLEEAAERYVENYKWEEEQDPWFDFMEGAKWQAERMYSEEEVLEILEHHTKYLETFIYQYIDKNDMEENKIWFEQFKKKL